jgi:hypothetical protein
MGWLVMESRLKDVEFNTPFDRPNLGGLSASACRFKSFEH